MEGSDPGPQWDEEGVKGDHPRPRYDTGRHRAGCWCCQRPRHALNILFVLPRAPPGALGAKHRAEGARSRLPAVSLPWPWPCPRLPVSSRLAVASVAAPQDPQGLPHGGEDHPVHLPGHKEGAQHRSPPPWHAPNSPQSTHLGAEQARGGGGVGAEVPEADGALRGQESLLHADGAAEAPHLCGTAGFAVPQFPQGLGTASRAGVQGHRTWWGAPAGTSTASPGSWRRLQPLTPHSSRSRRRRAGSR